jgi:hypothetical protein
MPTKVIPQSLPRRFSARRDLERWVFHWTLLAALGVFAAMAVPFWSGLVYTMDDLGGYHLPTRALYAQELAQGRILHWTPDLFGGFYLAGEGQVGMYHPLHVLLYRFVNLRAAFCLEVLASYPFLMAGVYLLLRRWRFRRDAAMLGALAFTFSGFALLHFVHVNAIAVLAHLPWLLLTIQMLATATTRRQRLLATIALALLTGSQCLLGYPQFVWFSLLTEVLYFAFLVANAPREALAAAACIAAGNVLGLLLGAVQLLPTLDVLGRSLRDDMTREALLTGSLHPWNLAQLVGPYLFRKRVVAANTHELGMYVGAVPLVLAAWLLGNLRRLRSHARLAAAAACFAAVMLLLAMGSWGGLYELQMLLPIIGKFRFPSRYIALFSLGVAVLAAIAFGELVQQVATPRPRNSALTRSWSNAVPISLAALGMALPLAAPALWGQEHLGTLRQVWMGPILLVAAVGLLGLAQRRQRWALVALPILTAVDLGAYGLSYSVYSDVSPLAAFQELPDPPPGTPGERMLADVFNPHRLRKGNRALLAGWKRMDGYAGLEPARVLSYNSLSALRVAGVHWVARLPETEQIVGLRECNEHWLAVPDPLPTVRLVTCARVSGDPAAALNALPLNAGVVCERPLPLAGGPVGRIESIVERPGEIRVRAAGETAQMIVVAQSYHRGWRVSVDGTPGRVERVDGDFLGCLLPPGDHQVVFRFRPISLVAGQAISALALALLAMGAVVALKPVLTQPSTTNHDVSRRAIN